MTTVAVEGNRRVGNMTDTETEQCVLDIKSWFERKSNVDLAAASSAGNKTCNLLFVCTIL
jgi:hypothetical protein